MALGHGRLDGRQDGAGVALGHGRGQLAFEGLVEDAAGLLGASRDLDGEPLGLGSEGRVVPDALAGRLDTVQAEWDPRAALGVVGTNSTTPVGGAKVGLTPP